MAKPVTPITPVILLPSECFVARRVALAPRVDPAAQAELALEGWAPFPLDQLLHGRVVAADGHEALVFAAHRRQFAGAGSEDWARAEAVFPAFLALLRPAPAPVIRVWSCGDVITVAGWERAGLVPAWLVARAVPAGGGAAFVAEAQARGGLGDVPVEEYTGEATVTLSADGRSFKLAINPGPGFTLAVGLAAAADVRDRSFLAARHRAANRDRWLWRGFVAALAGVGLAAVAAVGLAVAGGRVRELQARVEARAPEVERIATAQSLGERIGDLGRRRFAPLELLAVANQPRPPSVSFTRVGADSPLALEIDAQTPNAADLGAYETALRGLPELAAVETRDVRSRDGITTFSLRLAFKAAPASTPEGAR